jgi:hypothetical protein
MKTRNLGKLSGLVLVAAALSVGVPQELAAQADRDFLFRKPHFSLAFNVGYGMPTAGSDIYDFVTKEHTLERSDFNSMVVGGSFGVRITDQVELSLDVAHGSANTPSEFRDWVDQDDLPIEQNTKLSWTPLTVSLKGFLWERGRRVSRFAWVPGQWAPFIGAGAGWMYYQFKQSGDFVDFETYDIFGDTFRSEGDTGLFHLLAGAEWTLSPAFYLTGEGRYTWAEANLGRDFTGFDPIDLSGFQATVGLAVRF